MKVTKRFIFIVGLSIFMLGCASVDDVAPTDEGEFDENRQSDEWLGVGADLAHEFDRFVAETAQDSGIPGTAAALIYEGEVVMLNGYGLRDVDKQLPVTPETLFHIASTQKSMTAMLVATLVDEGIVTWDTPLVDIAPDFTLSSGGDTITLRHLLSMSSGIPDTAEDDFYDDGYEGSAFSLWPLLAETKPLDRPGAVFSYSNISTSMAGYAAVLVLEPDAADLDNAYGELLFERVIRPIGMETAVFSVDDARQSPHYGKSYR